MDKVLNLKKIRRAQRKRAVREKNGKIAEKESTERASAPLFFPSIPTGGVSYQYDVFLSFRGIDTRKGFIDHLYRKLISEGTVSMSVFKDDESLEIGEDINSEILDAIARSKISVPVISENYASSKWCLCELVHIMDCKESMSHMVFPIFYKVEPSDVRHQRGKFGEAFSLCEKRLHKKDIQKVKQALTRVSDLSGWESEKFANGFEGKLVEVVSKTIKSKLRDDFLPEIPKHLLGVDDHVKNIRNWVDTPSSHARMIVIYGMGGIGKTTLAKVVFDVLSNEFVHHSFLSDIRETALCSDILTLQKRLIKDILQVEQQVCKVDDGIKLMKSRLRGKKVLILLDDIDNQDQLNALAGERDWFSPGSIIIVTTRNETMLDRSTFQVDYKYELKELDYVHSLLLFERHAFPMGHRSKDFEGISRDIVSTMGGLPLAIKVVGSCLYEQTRNEVWEDLLKELRNKPDRRDVQRALKITYDGLGSMQKQIFLDIACFFIGKDRKYATYIKEGFEFYPHQEIEELELKCLIRIGDDGEFWMHDQLRDLGRTIARQEPPPQRRLKLCVDQEAFPKCLGYKDETALVVGKDMATVSFAEQLGDTDVLQATEVDSSLVDLDDDFDELMKGSETSSSTEPFEKKSHKRQRCANNDDKYATILKQLEQMASVINSFSQDNVDYSRLYNEVMKVDGYDEVTLGSVFDYLVENEKIGKAFMVKSANLQKVWIDKFLSKGEHNH